MSRPVKRVLVIIVLTVLVLVFSIRPLIRKQVHKSIDKIHDRYGINIQFDKFLIKGPRKFEILNCQVISANDTLLQAKEIRLRYAFSDLLLNRLLPVSLEMNEARITYRLDMAKDTMLQSNGQAGGLSDKKPDRLLKYLNQLPEYMDIEQTEIVLVKGSVEFTVELNRFLLKNQQYELHLNWPVDSNHQDYTFTGKLFHDRDNTFISVNSKDIMDFQHPFKPEVKLGFSGFMAEINVLQNNSPELNLEFSNNNVRVQHPMIAGHPFNMEHIKLDLLFKFKDNGIFLDTNAIISLNGFYWQPRFSYQNAPVKYTFKLKKHHFDPMQLYQSLPMVWKEHIGTIDVKGDLSLFLYVNVISAFPDSSFVDFRIKKHDLEILDEGNLDFGKLNNCFEHSIPSTNSIMLVCDSLDHFTPLADIPAHLKQAVLLSEDALFYQHRGFIGQAFNEALRKNLREGSFARGGSTISMQLVKNLYLGHEKTLSRKLEELIITWLLEESRQVPKERMFEIYLNIIEWGPDVYGIHDAASFYFDKKPEKLTIEESVFLTAIIPRPKKFKYYFDGHHQVREFYVDYFHVMAERMLARSYIDETIFRQLNPQVKLKGEAINYLKPIEVHIDSIREDTNLIIGP